MATSDTETVFSQIDGTATLLDGDGTPTELELDYVQSDVEWTEGGAPYTEAKSRGLHKSNPVLRKTGSDNVTGSMTLLVPSFRGASAITPYEFLTFTGLGSSLVTTARGDKKAFMLKLRMNATDAGGADQTVTFNKCVATSVKFNPAGQDGLMTLSFDFTDHEERPTYS